MVSMDGVESYVPLLISFVALIFVFGGAASDSLDPQWLEVFWSQPPVLSLPMLEERSYQGSYSSLPPSCSMKQCPSPGVE